VAKNIYLYTTHSALSYRPSVRPSRAAGALTVVNNRYATRFSLLNGKPNPLVS